MPDQELKPVIDAYNTAKYVLRGELANFKETIMDGAELEKAKERGYPLAVDCKGMPRINGWYQVDRRTATYESIFQIRAEELIRAGRWSEILRVNQSAVTAAYSSRPLTIFFGDGVNGGCFLNACGHSITLARVVLVKPTQEQAGVDIAALRRKRD